MDQEEAYQRLLAKNNNVKSQSLEALRFGMPVARSKNMAELELFPADFTDSFGSFSKLKKVSFLDYSFQNPSSSITVLEVEDVVQKASSPCPGSGL